MHQRLAEILVEKKNEVARLKKKMPAEIDGNLPPIRDFKAAISAPLQINLIAEIKFASPSAGRIRPKTDLIFFKAGRANRNNLIAVFYSDELFLVFIKRRDL